MANRKLGIEVDVTSSGNGFRKIEKETKAWVDSLKKADSELRELSGTTEKAQDDTLNLKNALEKAEKSVRNMDGGGLERVAHELKKAEREAEDYGLAMEMASRNANFDASPELQEIKRQLYDAGQEAQEFAGAMESAQRKGQWDADPNLDTLPTKLEEASTEADFLATALEKALKKAQVDEQAKDNIAELDEQLEKASQETLTWEKSLANAKHELRDFNQEADETAESLNQAEQAQRKYAQETENTESRIRRLNHELDDTENNLKDLSKPWKSVRTEAKKTEEQTEGVGRAFVMMAERAEKINKVIKPLNTLRFHSTQLAEAAGLIENKYRGAGNSTEVFEKIADRLDTTITSLERTIDRMAIGIKNLSENLDKQHKKNKAIGASFDVMGTEIHDAGEKAYYLNEAMYESSNELEVWKNKADIAALQAKTLRDEMEADALAAKRLDNALEDAGREVDEIGDEMNQSENQADDFEDRLDRLAKTLDRAGDQMEKVAHNTSNLGNELGKGNRRGEAFAETMGNLVSNAIEEAAEAIYEFTKESIQAFYDFDRQTREIFTLLPGASANMRKQMRRDVLLLGTELGRLPEEMLPAVYNALSAGIPEDNVLATVEIASNAARAGVSDLASTLKLGVSILNAQVTGVENITDVYDQLFFTVKNGVITMPELNEVMSQVTSIAGEAGVSMQDISAAMIVMTRQGDSAAEAAELLSIMLTQLSTSGTTLADTFENAAGQSFRTFVAQGGTLADAMVILQEHADDTGQALGDILGGGSPFFRDTQAARGALELTGKHLDELTHFSKEAEGAMGTMGEASAEMGESAELGALQARAAWEELKISFGDGAATLFEPLIKDATALVKVLSGNRKNQVSQHIDELIESGATYVEIGARVSKVFSEQNTVLGRVTGGYQSVLEQVYRLSATTGDFTKSNKELEKSLQAVLGEGLEFRDNNVFLNNQFLVTVDHLRDLNKEYDKTGNVLPTEQIIETTNALENFSETATFNAKTMRGGTGAARYYGASLQELSETNEIVSEKLERSAKLRLAEAEATGIQTSFVSRLIEVKTLESEKQAELNQRRVELTTALEAETLALETLEQKYSSYVASADASAFATTNWTDELFKVATQEGITQQQTLALALATGEYSDEQIEAMLKTAAMKVAVEQLGQQLADGTITTADAIASMQDFEAQLGKDYKAQFDVSDLDNAKTAAEGVGSALRAAAGNYKATFTTHNITINETQEKKGKSEDSSKTGGATPNHLGGQFRANEMLLVGDGPGGKFIPGISEYVAFDKPGTVLSAAQSAEMYRNQKLPPGLNGSGSTAVAEATDLNNTSPNVSIQITIIAQPGQSITGITEDSMMEAARKAGLLP